MTPAEWSCRWQALMDYLTDRITADLAVMDAFPAASEVAFPFGDFIRSLP